MNRPRWVATAVMAGVCAAGGCTTAPAMASNGHARGGRRHREFRYAQARPFRARRRGNSGRAAEHLIFDEEFEGSAGAAPDEASWNFDEGGGGWGNGELESNTGRGANVLLDGAGDLAITARREMYTGKDGITRGYTSARLQTLGRFQFRYGRVEARIEVPEGQGLVGQFWALGAEGYEGVGRWPDCGEIDMMEVLGQQPDVVLGHLHGPWPWDPNQGLGGRASDGLSLSKGFHVYGARWEPGRVTFTLDGNAYATLTPADLPPGTPWPFGHPFFLLLDVAVGGEWPGAPSLETHFPARMLVDWVRVWQ
jgi:beta-glucanase (GH16 family)